MRRLIGRRLADPAVASLEELAIEDDPKAYSDDSATTPRATRRNRRPASARGRRCNRSRGLGKKLDEQDCERRPTERRSAYRGRAARRCGARARHRELEQQHAIGLLADDPSEAFKLADKITAARRKLETHQKRLTAFQRQGRIETADRVSASAKPRRWPHSRKASAMTGSRPQPVSSKRQRNWAQPCRITGRPAEPPLRHGRTTCFRTSGNSMRQPTATWPAILRRPYGCSPRAQRTRSSSICPPASVIWSSVKPLSVPR
jgi:hypothetical protein